MTSHPSTFEMTAAGYSLDGKPILKDITLRATERRIGIVGRNGSGKTSFARLLSGLIPATEGRIRVCGEDVANDRKRAIRTVGILFQNPDHQIIFPTVEDELAFGLLQLGLTPARAADKVACTLDEFGKSHWAKAATHGLSQGQKQLVCLMSIIAMEPRVVILDEPFSGLDIPTRIQLSHYLDRIDAAVVHISHDPTNLVRYDRVIWLDEGRVRLDGAAKPTLERFTQHMTDLGGCDDISDLAG